MDTSGIDDSLLIDLLEMVDVSTEIGGYKFNSRFEFQSYESDLVFGAGYTEISPDLQNRDRHLLFARQEGLLQFDVQKYDDHEDYFGTAVLITEKGRQRLRPWRNLSLSELVTFAMDKLGWPIIGGIIIVIVLGILGLGG